MKESNTPELVNTWYDSEGNKKDISDLPMNTTIMISGNKQNFFFSKNNKNIRYCGRESGGILVVREL